MSNKKTIINEALRIHSEGVDAVAALLIENIKCSKELCYAYEDIARWSNRWATANQALVRLSNEAEALRKAIDSKAHKINFEGINLEETIADKTEVDLIEAKKDKEPLDLL